MKHSSFDATTSALDAETSALDVETSAFEAATSAIARRSFDAETSALGTATSAVARSYRRYWRGCLAFYDAKHKRLLNIVKHPEHM